MTQHREIDTSMIQVIKGSSASMGLKDIKVQLALIQAALSMSLEGTNRATATQVTDRAMNDYDITATPSFTGQLFSGLGIGTVTSHGKNRFVLEYEQLESIRKDLASKCEEQTRKLNEALESFQDLPKQIEQLQSQWQEVLKVRARTKELIQLINEERSKPSRLPQLEAEARRLREEATQVEELQQECRELSRKLKTLPSLEKKKQSLEAAISKYQAEEKAIASQEAQVTSRKMLLARREAELAREINRLRERQDWIDLATVEQAIKAAKSELNDLSKQLGEKRSLLGRIIRRK